MATPWRYVLVVWIAGVGALALFDRSKPTIAEEASVALRYASPRPNGQMVPIATTLAIRAGVELAAESVSPGVFSVRGSLSGEHSGSVVLADDHQTVIFKPTMPFARGETVAVIVSEGLRTASGLPVSGIRYSFATTRGLAQAIGQQALSVTADAVGQNSAAVDVSARDNTTTALTLPADFPVMTATVTHTLPTGEYYFLAPLTFGAPGLPHYNTIIDGNGQVVFYMPVETGTDFKRQPDGTLSFFSAVDNAFHILDETYSEVRVVEAGNVYVTDFHELLILPDGHALLMIYDSQPVDMSLVVPGGQPDAIVIGLVIQELDTSGNVVFEWRSWDHIDITDSYIDLTTPSVDYIHGNAIEVDIDGNLMISSRNTADITKSNRQTGDVMWRLGGKSNQFTSSNEI